MPVRGRLEPEHTTQKLCVIHLGLPLPEPVNGIDPGTQPFSGGIHAQAYMLFILFIL